MANNVTNILQIDADSDARLEEILAAIQRDEVGPGSIDFHKIVPSSDGDDWFEAHNRDWGTKWNAYGFNGDVPPYEPGSGTLQFLTAWARPEPVIRRLSAMIADARLLHQWADEDIGHNVGEARYLAGAVVEEFEPTPGAKEAFEMSAEIIGADLESLGLRLLPDGSNYDYFDEEETLDTQGFGAIGGMHATF